MKYTILGAGGTISEHLSNMILSKNEKLRLVSRTGHQKPNAEMVKADLLNAQEASQAIKNSETVFLLTGLPYDTKVWQRDWPVLMNNVIEACIEHQCKLIFFDNVYAYGKVDGKMVEETPYNPLSKKGEVRAKIATKLMDEVKRGNLTASIARAADFYGPNAPLSLLTAMVFDNMKKGKASQWFCDLDKIHSFTYTPDCGKALYALANNDAAFNQIWHLPTKNPALTGRQYIELAAKYMGATTKTQVAGPFLNRILGLFIPILREFQEMLYQYDSDYYFDSTKFETAFKILPTEYEEGMKQTALFYKK